MTGRLTKRERGIALEWPDRQIESLGFRYVRRCNCMFRVTTRLNWVIKLPFNDRLGANASATWQSGMTLDQSPWSS